MLNVSLIKSITPTWGSGAIYSLLDNDEFYYVKKSNYSKPPFTDLINELVVNKIHTHFGIPVPPTTLCLLDFDAFEEKLLLLFKENTKRNSERRLTLKNTFTREKFNHPIFASKEMENILIMTDREKISSFNPKSYSNILDFIKIAFLDFWLGNKDRSISNLNIIIAKENENEKKSNKLIPIDNCQCIHNVKNYQHLDTKNLFTEYLPQKNLLNSTLAENIRDFTRIKLSQLKHDLLKGYKVLQESNYLVNLNIPVEWGFSDEQIVYLDRFLFQSERFEHSFEFLDSFYEK